MQINARFPKQIKVCQCVCGRKDSHFVKLLLFCQMSVTPTAGSRTGPCVCLKVGADIFGFRAAGKFTAKYYSTKTIFTFLSIN